MVNNWS